MSRQRLRRFAREIRWLAIVSVTVAAGLVMLALAEFERWPRLG